MKNILIIIRRLIGLPFFMALALIGTITLWFKYILNYIIYGGEAISYTEKTQKKTINDVFEKVQEMINDEKTDLLRDCVSETWGAKSFSEAQELFDKFLKRRGIK